MAKRIELYQATFNGSKDQQPQVQSVNSKQASGGRHEDFVESLLKPRNRLQWLLYNSKVLYPSDNQRPEEA